MMVAVGVGKGEGGMGMFASRPESKWGFGGLTTAMADRSDRIFPLY